MIYFICPEWDINEPAPSILIAIKWLYAAWISGHKAHLEDQEHNILALT